MTAPHATIEYGLRTYGARMKLAEVLGELKISESTFRRGMASQIYPRPVHCGVWSTEAVMRAAADMETRHHEDAFDPFAA